MKILLFDDILQNRQKVGGALRSALGNRGTIQDFTPGVGRKTDGTYEERLLLDLGAAPNDNADLIVADRDLSGYGDNYPGLSESTVRRVADIIGIPECGYARGEPADAYIQHAEMREACIRLALVPDINDFAQRVVAIADGFLKLDAELAQRKTAGRLPPGKLLANILGKPEYADKISLYASGDQGRLQVIRGMKEDGDEKARRRRLSCLLGYWLWDSVLRYPGVTLGEIPASSYLNIEEEIFRAAPEIRELLSAARYTGPFAKAKIPMWWRGMLDDMLSEVEYEDGNGFVSSKLGKPIAKSICCENSAIAAGYYCLLKEKPVSFENSKGGLPWLPRGADLTRVSTSALEELGPWF